MQVWTWYLFALIHSSSAQMVPDHLLPSIIVLGAGERALAHGPAFQFLTLW